MAFIMCSTPGKLIEIGTAGREGGTNQRETSRLGELPSFLPFWLLRTTTESENLVMQKEELTVVAAEWKQKKVGRVHRPILRRGIGLLKVNFFTRPSKSWLKIVDYFLSI